MPQIQLAEEVTFMHQIKSYKQIHVPFVTLFFIKVKFIFRKHLRHTSILSGFLGFNRLDSDGIVILFS